MYSEEPLHVGMRQYWRDFDALEDWSLTLAAQVRVVGVPSRRRRHILLARDLFPARRHRDGVRRHGADDRPVGVRAGRSCEGSDALGSSRSTTILGQSATSACSLPSGQPKICACIVRVSSDLGLGELRNRRVTSSPGVDHPAEKESHCDLQWSEGRREQWRKRRQQRWHLGPPGLLRRHEYPAAERRPHRG
jgi:hypothetical protein